MGLEIIGLIAGLLAIIPVIISALNRRKANRNEIGKVESKELLDGMDRVDRDAAARLQPLAEQGGAVHVRGVSSVPRKRRPK